MKVSHKCQMDKAISIALEKYHNPTHLRPIVAIRGKPMLLLKEFASSGGCVDTLDSIMASKITPYYKHASRLVLKPSNKPIGDNSVIYGNGKFYHLKEHYPYYTKFYRADTFYAMRIKWGGEIVYLCTYKHLIDKNTFLKYVHFYPRDIFLVRDKKLPTEERRFPNHVFKIREATEREHGELLGELRHVFRTRKRKKPHLCDFVRSN